VARVGVGHLHVQKERPAGLERRAEAPKRFGVLLAGAAEPEDAAGDDGGVATGRVELVERLDEESGVEALPVGA
jgi:hypothetical protein